MAICHPFGHLRGNLRASVVRKTGSPSDHDGKLAALEFTMRLNTLSAVMTNVAMRREVCPYGMGVFVIVHVLMMMVVSLCVWVPVCVCVSMH